MAKPVEEMGNKFGKPDIERLGLFSEAPYMNGKGYVSPFPISIISHWLLEADFIQQSRYKEMRLEKGKNLLAGGPKEKRDWQDCYFDKEFKRLFTGEALKGRGRKEKPSRYKNISERAFTPTGPTKWHSTPGDFHGTFQGKVDEFSPVLRKRPPFKHEGPNCLSSPAKKGGCGYPNICINPYPTHSVEKYGVKQKYKQYGQVLAGPMVLGMHPKPYFEKNPYKDPDKFKPGPTYVPPKEKDIPLLQPGRLMPTGPGKWPGGCKAGCFDKFPEYKPEKYRSVYEILYKAHKNTGGIMYPPSNGGKTFYTCSVLNENLSFRVNATTYKNYEPNYCKHLVD